ncbi:MAG: hypothetical protein Q9159_004722 [Coniocarpon cinnabarinum]
MYGHLQRMLEKKLDRSPLHTPPSTRVFVISEVLDKVVINCECDDPNKRAARKALLVDATGKKGSAANELTDRQRANLRTELKYLSDPLKLANYVQHIVDQDYDKALALVRLSSRAVSNTVAWNHLIDSNMRRGKTKAAIDLYSEMKKRAQKPDSHTYLLLLRGLGDHAQHPHSLGRALSLYHSLSAEGNKVAPTIRHTNAVLKVCARANDMDSLWDIASRLPESGPHAADHWTFTTILNNLRLNALTGGIDQEVPQEQNVERKDEAVIQGRRLWELVVKRRRAGDIQIDEDLACSMGRLLLLSSRPRDWDDVLSLVEQTMGVHRMVPRIGTDERTGLYLHSRPAVNNLEGNERARHDDYRSEATSAATNDHNSESPSDTFTELTRPVRPPLRPNVRKSSMHAYAKPSNSTLSLVLEACLKMVIKKPAAQYWDLLTSRSGYGIVPDLDNIHMRLRILRQSHSSAEIVHLLRSEMPAAKVGPMKKTFAIAMAGCARDSQNLSSVPAAGQVLDLALQHLAEPGSKTFLLYLDTVTAVANVVEKKTPESTSGVNSDGLENVRTAVRMQLRALSRLEPGTVGLRSMLNFGTDPTARQSTKSRIAWEDEVNRERAGAIELMKRMVAIYDHVVALAQGRERELGLRAGDRTDIIGRKKKLQAFVQRQHVRGVKRQISSRGWRPARRDDGRVQQLRKVQVEKGEDEDEAQDVEEAREPAAAHA